MATLIHRLLRSALNLALSGVVNFIVIKALIGLYNAAGAYNGDYSFMVSFAYWLAMGFIYAAGALAVIAIVIEER